MWVRVGLCMRGREVLELLEDLVSEVLHIDAEENMSQQERIERQSRAGSGAQSTRPPSAVMDAHHVAHFSTLTASTPTTVSISGRAARSSSVGGWSPISASAWT